MAKQQAVAEVRKLGLGRFIEPATRRIVTRVRERDFVQSAWRLAQEASNESSNKSSPLATLY
jgi:hypothetical protein